MHAARNLSLPAHLPPLRAPIPRHEEYDAGPLSVLMASLPGGAVIISPEGRVSDCNPVAIDMLGAPLLHAFWAEVIARAFAPRADDGHEVSLRDGRRVRIATQPLPGGQAQLVQLIDLTETRTWQARVAHQQRLSELGKMAATLAHQLRTPLSTATLYASHLQRAELPVRQRQEFALEILTQLQHMEQQIRALLLLSRNELPLTDSVKASEWIDRWRKKQDGRLEIKIQVQSTAAVKHLRCHLVALDEAVSNLVSNAIEAVPAKGPVCLHLVSAERGIELVVEDQGPGLDRAQLEALESPFFTTKTNGNGLGLALVRRIAVAHGGAFSLSSEPGIGTAARLFIPAMEESPL